MGFFFNLKQREVQFLRKGKWPAAKVEQIYHSCYCFHVKNVSLCIGFLVASLVPIAMIYFIYFAQQQSHLKESHSRLIIAGTCIASFAAEGMIGSFLIGITHAKPFFMLPYLIVTSVLFVVSLAGLTYLAYAIISGFESMTQWKDDLKWHKYMQDIVLFEFALFALIILQAWMLAVQWRCFVFFYKRNKKQKISTASDANLFKDSTASEAQLSKISTSSDPKLFV